MHKEYRAGETTFGPLQLRSIWEPHILRDFELRVIMQVAGCEDVAAQLLAGGSVSTDERAPLDVANYVAKQKGYQPLFLLSGKEVRIAAGVDGKKPAADAADLTRPWTPPTEGQSRTSTPWSAMTGKDLDTQTSTLHASGTPAPAA